MKARIIPICVCGFIIRTWHICSQFIPCLLSVHSGKSWVMSKHFQTACQPITALSVPLPPYHSDKHKWGRSFCCCLFWTVSVCVAVLLWCFEEVMSVSLPHVCVSLYVCPRGRFGLCSCSVPPQMGDSYWFLSGNRRDIQLFITLIRHHQFINPKTGGSDQWLFLTRPLLPLFAMNGKFTAPQMRTNMEAEVCQPPDSVSYKVPQDLNVRVLP